MMSSDLSRAKWSKETLHLFCDLCIQYGHRMAWKVLRPTYHMLKTNKWDWMKSRWSLWKAFKAKHTDLHWDYAKGTVTATDEWWNNKIQENMHFKAFRESTSLSVVSGV